MTETVRPSVLFCLVSSKLVLLPRLSHSLFVAVCVRAAGFSVELAVAVAIRSSSYVTHYSVFIFPSFGTWQVCRKLSNFHRFSKKSALNFLKPPTFHNLVCPKVPKIRK
jgi:hypothetical protein